MSGLTERRLDSLVFSSRDRLANTIMIAAVLVGLPTLLASMYRSIDTGWQSVFYFQISSYLATVLMVLFRHRIATVYKQLFICTAFLILGVSGLVSWGLVGMGETLLIVFVVVTTAFFGIRAGVIATASILVIFGLVGAGFISDMLKLKFDITSYHHVASSWFANAIVITFFTGVAITALSSIDIALKETLLSEIKTENLLQSVILSMDEGMLIYNEKGKIIFSNNSAQILFDMRENELLNYDIEEISLRVASTHKNDTFKVISEIGAGINEAEVAITQGKGLRWCHVKARKILDPVDASLNITVVTLNDITEKVETANKLNKTERLFRLVTNNANDMVSVHDREGNYIYVSPSCEYLLGYKEKEILGRNAYDFIHEDDIAEVRETHKKLQEKSQATRSTFRIKCSDGTYIWFESIVHNVVDGNEAGNAILVVSRDVSENIRTKNALISKEQQLRTITDALPNYVAELIAGSRFSYVNEAYRELTGMAINEIVGKKIEEVFTKEAAEEIENYLLKVNQGEEVSLEREINISGNELRWVVLHFVPVKSVTGQVQSIVMLIVDMTKQNKAERDREELRLQLAQTQKMEAIGQLTGGIAHDFNNMLASIQGYAELLTRKEWQDEKDARYLNNILVSAKRGAELVDKLLAFSRGRKKELSHQPLIKIVDESIEMVRSIMPSSIKIESSIDIAEDLIECDTSGLNQMIVNLCINARDAMQGNGTLRIEVKMLEIDRHECSSCHMNYTGRYFVVSVSDTGEGINEQYISHIFEPFFSTKEVGKGSGMGLAMVHGIVHEHNGHIRVKSIEGQGCSFSIYLPVVELHSEVDEIAETVPMYDPVSEPDISGIRVMLVDDDAGVAGYIREVLELLGYQVHWYDDSIQAVEDFSKDRVDVDIVLTDQTMPGMTGAEMAKAMWSKKPGQPIVLMSGYSQYVDKEDAQNMGFCAYLHKPTTTAEIKQAMLIAVSHNKSVT